MMIPLRYLLVFIADLARQKESRVDYYSDETSEIGTLMQLSSGIPKKLQQVLEEQDIGFNSWIQHRPSGKLVSFANVVGVL